MTRAVTAVQEMQGIREVQQQGTAQLLITYEPSLTNVAEITATIQLRAGFEAVPEP